MKSIKISFNHLTSHPVRILLDSGKLHFEVHIFTDTISPIDDHDLMDTNVNDELTVLDLFDPLRQCDYPFQSEEILLDTRSSTSSPSSLYPIKLRLKLSTCPEMKPFYQLVQNIRNEYLSKEVKSIFFVFIRILSMNFRLQSMKYPIVNVFNV
jgi:hypothetical protein